MKRKAPFPTTTRRLSVKSNKSCMTSGFSEEQSRSFLCSNFRFVFWVIPKIKKRTTTGGRRTSDGSNIIIVLTRTIPYTVPGRRSLSSAEKGDARYPNALVALACLNPVVSGYFPRSWWCDDIFIVRYDGRFFFCDMCFVVWDCEWQKSVALCNVNNNNNLSGCVIMCALGCFHEHLLFTAALGGRTRKW